MASAWNFRRSANGLSEQLKLEHDLEAFVGLLSLEIWGRLLFLHQRLEEVADQVTRPSGQTGAGSILNIKEQPSCDGAMISLQSPMLLNGMALFGRR